MAGVNEKRRGPKRHFFNIDSFYLVFICNASQQQNINSIHIQMINPLSQIRGAVEVRNTLNAKFTIALFWLEKPLICYECLSRISTREGE